ncbi:MAG TPA: rod-binding protein [Devosiaceae bacterium]|jgi:Rod binding domain-containing protein|nr:rod-binding protein [Devosiaceae bacterium]
MEFPLATTRPGSPHPHSAVRQQAEELEGVFLNTLMKEMFASIESDSDAFGGGFAEETWRGMQAEQFAAGLAEAGGIGLADAIVANLLAVQEAASPQSQFNFSKGAPR